LRRNSEKLSRGLGKDDLGDSAALFPAGVLGFIGRGTPMSGFGVVLLVALGIFSPVKAQQQSGADETLAGLLMRNGFLCSRVVDKRPSGSPNQMEVTCIEYRYGTKRVRYIIDLSTGKASKAE